MQVIEKDLLIQEKEKLYIELRKILARQPGPEAAKQMVKYGQKLHEKMKDLRYMTLELATYQVLSLPFFVLVSITFIT